MSSSLSTARISSPPLSFEELKNNCDVFKTLQRGTGVYINRNYFRVEDRWFSGFRKMFNTVNLTCGFDPGDVKKLLDKMKESIEYYKDNLPETANITSKEFKESVLYFSHGWSDLCTEYYEKKQKNIIKSEELKKLFKEAIEPYILTIDERIRTVVRINYSLSKKEGGLESEVESMQEEKKKKIMSDAVLRRGFSLKMVDFERAKEQAKALEKPKKAKTKVGSGKWAAEEVRSGLSPSPSDPVLSTQLHSVAHFAPKIISSPLAKWREGGWLHDQRRNSLALKSGLMTRRNSLKFDDVIHGTIWRREIGNHNENIADACKSIDSFSAEKIYGNTMSEKLSQVSEQCCLAKASLKEAEQKLKALANFICQEIEGREQRLEPLKKCYKAAYEEYEQVNKKVDKLEKYINSLHETIQMMASIIESGEKSNERMKELKETLEKNSQDLTTEVTHRAEVNDRYKRAQEEFDLLKREFNEKISIVSSMDKEFNELFDGIRLHFLCALDLYEKMPAEVL